MRGGTFMWDTMAMVVKLNKTIVDINSYSSKVSFYCTWLQLLRSHYLLAPLDSQWHFSQMNLVSAYLGSSLSDSSLSSLTKSCSLLMQ